MTLKSRLILLMITLFLCAFFATLAISIFYQSYEANQKTFLQLESTVTTLGTSLPPALKAGDKLRAKAIVKKVFNQGYHQSITVTDLYGNTMIHFSVSINLNKIPKWFINLIPIHYPQHQTLLAFNEEPLGYLKIKTHPGHFYQTLWQRSYKLFWVFATIYFLATAVGIILLKRILKPLDNTFKQANILLNQPLFIQKRLPAAKELKVVAVTLNKLSRKLKNSLTEQAKLTENLYKRTFQDSLTKLINRNYFNKQLQEIAQNKNEFTQACLFLLELEHFKEYNDKYGSEKGDELITELATTLNNLFKKIPFYSLARFRGTTFALILFHITYEESKKTAQLICETIQTLLAQESDPSDKIKVHLGLVNFSHPFEPKTLLTTADTALRLAKTQDFSPWYCYNDSKLLPQSNIYTKAQWYQLIQTIIQQKKITLMIQPAFNLVTNKPKEILHHEISIRPEQDQHLLPGNTLFTMAEYLELDVQLDKLVIQTLLAEIKKHGRPKIPFALNLSYGSIKKIDFLHWLLDELKPLGSIKPPLIFEIAEHKAIHYLNNLHIWIEKLNKFNCKMAIDQFGKNFTDFSYLHSLKLDYIKPAENFIYPMDKSLENQFFIKSLVNIAHMLDIKIIAANVQTETQFNTLLPLKIDGVQGILFKPERPYLHAE